MNPRTMAVGFFGALIALAYIAILIVDGAVAFHFISKFW